MRVARDAAPLLLAAVCRSIRTPRPHFVYYAGAALRSAHALSSGADTAAEQTSDLQLPQPRRPTAEHTIPWRARWRASTACAACLIHGSAGVCRGTYVTLQQAGRSDLTSGAATPAAVTISSTARRWLVVQPYVMLPSTARRGTALLLRLCLSRSVYDAANKRGGGSGQSCDSSSPILTILLHRGQAIHRRVCREPADFTGRQGCVCWS